MSYTKKLMIIGGLFLGVLDFFGGVSAEITSGPLLQDFSLTLSAGHRVEALGPLVSYEVRESQKQWAFPPLFSHSIDNGPDAEEFDVLYPLFTCDRFGTEYRLQFLQYLSFAGGQNQREDVQQRLTLFPFYFQQRSSDPDLDYTAFVPFYGRLRNRLFRDEISFVLFPIYGQSRKKDVVTDNYLYPLFHVRRGDALKGWQFWPLVGYEHKDVTSRTNSQGEMETIGGHSKVFALWPFFFNNCLDLGTPNPQTQRVLLPIYSLSRSPNRDSSTYLWPIFTYTDDREKKYHEWGAPWPLVTFARGEGKTANRIWPLFGQSRNPILESDFYLWPLYYRSRAHAPPLDRTRTRILFFLYSDVVEKNEEAKTALERTDLWPLFSARRDHNGNERLQLFAPLEPLLPNNKSIERNYSPLWSIWRSETNAKTGGTSQSLLWNLYRLDTMPQKRKCSLLFGLFQYQSGPEGRRMRIFYIPVLKAQKTAAAWREN